MVGRIIILLGLVTTLLPGCGSSSDGTGSPLAPYLPSPGSSPVPDQPPSSDRPPVGSYPTTDEGGYFSVIQSRTLALDSGVTVLGFASDTSGFYMLEAVSLSGGITRWRVLSTGNDPGTGVASWTTDCDMLGDNTTRLGFAMDATYFYLPGAILSDPNHPQYLRRFLRSSCVEVSVLDTGQNLESSSEYSAGYSIANGQLYYEIDTLNSPELNSWGLLTGSFTSTPLSPSLAGVNMGYVYSLASTTSSGFWALTYSQMWKLDQNGNAIAWANLPDNGSYALDGAIAVVPIDSNTVVLAFVTSSQLTRYFIDVSQF